MDRSQDRREQLIAAAVAGELSDHEQVEVDRWCADDAGFATELAELTALVGGLRDLGTGWTEEPPPATLGHDVGRAVDAGESRSTPRRRGSALVLAAVALVAAGVGGTLVVERVLAVDGSAPTGPPGTLGAVEQVAVTTEPSGTSVELSLVAHTWGTETVMEVDGFDVGARYEVVLLDREGDAVPSGSFIGSEVPIDCRVNAALLREDVTAVEIIGPGGEVLVDAPVPAVKG